jgi:hypothetical protein
LGESQAPMLLIGLVKVLAANGEWDGTAADDEREL